MRICSKCGLSKSESDYYKEPNRKDGLAPDCKECRKAKVSKWQQDNKEQVNAKNQQWRLENPERYKEQCRQGQQRYRANHPDKIQEALRVWNAENKDKKVDYQRKRRALQLDQAGYMPDGWFEAMVRVYGYQCAQCGSTENIQVDHVVALANGGLDEIGNLQFLCGKHNASKGNRHDTDYRTVILRDTVTT